MATPPITLENNRLRFIRVLGLNADNGNNSTQVQFSFPQQGTNPAVTVPLGTFQDLGFAPNDANDQAKLNAALNAFLTDKTLMGRVRGTPLTFTNDAPNGDSTPGSLANIDDNIKTALNGLLEYDGTILGNNATASQTLANDLMIELYKLQINVILLRCERLPQNLKDIIRNLVTGLKDKSSKLNAIILSKQNDNLAQPLQSGGSRENYYKMKYLKYKAKYMKNHP